jgi:pimeloyl-ACP methyl ester carboxylesterase
MVTTHRYVWDAPSTGASITVIGFSEGNRRIHYREFGDIVAAARAQLSTDLVNRQVAAMDAWHRTGIGNREREINVPVLVATGTADIVIPPSNALKLVNAIPGAWLAQFNGGGHAFMYQYPRPLADLVNSFLELG